MNLQAEIKLNPWSVYFAQWSVSPQTIREISVCGDTDRGGNLVLMTSLFSHIVTIQKSRI
ncbi:MAG: hypothetical protein RI909_1948 [Bacteroidota bacterium]|jgi:hypothetical protein